MYTYPSRRTGTAEDLMGIITRAAELAILREGTALPVKTERQRALWEPAFNLAGMLVRGLMSLLPADWVLAVHELAMRRLSGGGRRPPGPPAPELARAAAEAEALRAQTGRPPALIALLSHPPVLGEASRLNFELVRDACAALRAVRGRPCRPRLVVAVDAYALDTATLPAEGLYAGFMGLYHLGLDRLALARSGVSARLLAAAAWPRFVSRLLCLLGGGGEAIMALSGGVPFTARVLYTTREWIARRRAASPRRAEPDRVLEALRACEGFRAFLAGGPLGPGLRRSAWRQLEGWVMSAVAGHPWDERRRCAASAQAGELDAATREDLLAALAALGYPEAARGEALEELAEEFRRQTPWRARFFRLLERRVLRRGRPIVFLPLVHREGQGAGVSLREAWSWTGSAAGGRVRARRAGREEEMSAAEFAVRFVSESYP